MYKKTGTHKSTAMDSFAAPREEGLIVSILNNFGFAQSEGGRFAAGLKYDFVKAIDNVTSTALATEIVDMIGSETARLQAERRTSTKRVTMPTTPEGAIRKLKANGMSLDELETFIKLMKKEEAKK
tara:strand:+ start:55 stop:432 length:378 start_codon:yes stop_codon:yes gene_type:complete